MFSRLGSQRNLCLGPFICTIKFALSWQIVMDESDIFGVSIMMHTIILMCRFEEFVAKVIMKHRGVDKDAAFEYDGVSVTAYNSLPVR